MQRLFYSLFIIISCLKAMVHADIRSTTGEINIYPNTSGPSVITINEDGLNLSGNQSIAEGLILDGPLTYTLPTLTSSNLSITQEHLVLANTSPDNLTLSLPYAGNLQGRVLKIKKTHPENRLTLESDISKIDHYHDVLYLNETEYGQLLPQVQLLSSDNTWLVLDAQGVAELWSPASSSNTLAWYDASRESSLIHSSNQVSSWRDLSGNDDHLIQNTAGAQGTTGTNTLNRLNVLSFGADFSDFYIASSMSLPADGNVSIFCVAKIDSTENQFSSLLSMNAADNDWQLDADTAGQFEAQLNSSNLGFGTISGGGDHTGAAQVFSTVFHSGSTAKVFINGSQDSSGSYTTPINNSVNFGVFTNRNQDSLMEGYVAEIIITTSIDTASTQRIEGYLAWKWGLEAQLDASHPYKTLAPQ